MRKRQSLHGDYDHLGSSIKILDSIKVNNVILNSGNDNKLNIETSATQKCKI